MEGASCSAADEKLLLVETQRFRLLVNVGEVRAEVGVFVQHLCQGLLAFVVRFVLINHLLHALLAFSQWGLDVSGFLA